MYNPLNPTFILAVKLGYTGVYEFFLFLIQNIDCGASTPCFEHICRKYQNVSTDLIYLFIIFQFLQLQKVLYIAWACFRNAESLVSRLGWMCFESGVANQIGRRHNLNITI